jgi:hypothetical protein
LATGAGAVVEVEFSDAEVFEDLAFVQRLVAAKLGPFFGVGEVCSLWPKETKDSASNVITSDWVPNGSIVRRLRNLECKTGFLYGDLSNSGSNRTIILEKLHRLFCFGSQKGSGLPQPTAVTALGSLFFYRFTASRLDLWPTF